MRKLIAIHVTWAVVEVGLGGRIGTIAVEVLAHAPNPRDNRDRHGSLTPRQACELLALHASLFVSPQMTLTTDELFCHKICATYDIETILGRFGPWEVPHAAK